MKKSLYLVALMSIVSFSGMRGMLQSTLNKLLSTTQVWTLDDQQVAHSSQLVKGQKYKIGSIGNTQEFTYEEYLEYPTINSLVGYHFHKVDECQLILDPPSIGFSWKKLYSITAETGGYWKDFRGHLFDSDGKRAPVSRQSEEDSFSDQGASLHEEHEESLTASERFEKLAGKYLRGWNRAPRNYFIVHGAAFVAGVVLYKWWNSGSKSNQAPKRIK